MAVCQKLCGINLEFDYFIHYYRYLLLNPTACRRKSTCQQKEKMLEPSAELAAPMPTEKSGNAETHQN